MQRWDVNDMISQGDYKDNELPPTNATDVNGMISQGDYKL